MCYALKRKSQDIYVQQHIASRVKQENVPHATKESTVAILGPVPFLVHEQEIQYRPEIESLKDSGCRHSNAFL